MNTHNALAESHKVEERRWREIFSLGAPLYVPALHVDVEEILYGQKHEHLRSVILCAEDSLWPHQRPGAIERLLKCLASFEPDPTRAQRPRIFFRPAHPEDLARVLSDSSSRHFTGYVLPKFDLQRSSEFFDVLNQHLSSNFALGAPWIMPILESPDILSPYAVADLAEHLSTHPLRELILMLRIGAHDLYHLLASRRMEGETVYEGPLREVISSLVTQFYPRQFMLSAPAFDGLNDSDTLKRELAGDLRFGLFAKSAIHPHQVPIIERGYRVLGRELDAARKVLEVNSPATQSMDGRMLEAQVHTRWARMLIARAEAFGIC